MVRLLTKRFDTKSNVKLDRFQSQLHTSYMSSHTEELWYNKTVCLWMTLYTYIYIYNANLHHNWWSWFLPTHAIFLIGWRLVLSQAHFLYKLITEEWCSIANICMDKMFILHGNTEKHWRLSLVQVRNVY